MLEQRHNTLEAGEIGSLRSPQDTEKGDLVILCMIFHIVPTMQWHEVRFANLWNVSYVTCNFDPSSPRESHFMEFWKRKPDIDIHA